ncbi:Elongation factor-like GTPase 1 [Nosema granulosis]|uniref:Elongation factor-like GTPase 1 n=1 Tax=Nosema granulosis TaxID=83296 RepID=A0A9P6H1Y4_9MICR|nr:Elongation factor-like GTPase 1 [Nosema granulosis]
MEIKKTIITGVVAHVDHGKTTLIDSLVATQGRISKTLAGDLRYMDSREDEQERGITLKLSAITLLNNEVEHIIIDTPGHADLEFLVENNSVLSDCFLILIDAIEGITPRTYSLINYIAHDSAILVINKIDKIEEENDAYDTIFNVIKSANAMIGEELFSWENNNVILSCATLCFGINYNHAKNTLGTERCNLKGAIKFIYIIEKKIATEDVDGICGKWKIKNKNRKSILSTMMPLGDIVFDSIESTFSKQNLMKNIMSQKTPLRIEEQINEEDTLLFVSLALLKDPNLYTRENMMFIARLFQGSVSVGDELYNNGDRVVIEEMFLFGIGSYKKVDTVTGSKLICVRGKLKKNTLLCSKSNISYKYLEKHTPFYKTKLILKDENMLNNLKSLLRIIINTEQCLKLKVNKFNELEVLASGKVQVEKLLIDIKNSKIEVSKAESDLIFCEYAKRECFEEFEDEDFKMKIKIDGIFDKSPELNSNGNIFNIKSTENLSGTIESVLNIFVSCGPVIRESIKQTYFEVDVVEKHEDVDKDNLFRLLKNNIKETYLKTWPSITAYFYRCGISIGKQYVGRIYNGINRFRYILINEEYDASTAFYTINTFIPHFIYEDFLEVIGIRSRGTAYIKTIEHGFIFKLDFSDFVHQIKESKGLLTSEKIVDNPEKQRTLKR